MKLGGVITKNSMKNHAKFSLSMLILLALSLSTACSGGGHTGTTLPIPAPTPNTPPPPTTYTIAGSVSGVAGSGLVLQNNGADNVSIAQGGSFTFAIPVASGTAYQVTVLTQPSNPAQTCVVANGSGKAAANITGVQVTCTTITFTVGGAVQGLTGSGLMLQNNGVDSLSVSADGAFAFANPLWQGSSYNVTVLSQPSSPAQTCSIAKGAGSALANVTSVAVACTTNSPVGHWTWMGGGESFSQSGRYGTLGAAAPDNVPGSRDNAASWSDAAGNFWLFGGFGLDSAGVGGGLNDLWKYSAGQWTWVSGANVTDQQSTYGTQGTAAPGNTPGARQSSMVWMDASGNFWLFGGSGFDSTGFLGYLNDLWEFHAGQWAWMGGSNLANAAATYGTPGTPDTNNAPGARSGSVVWTDAAGNLWLFGGFGPGSPAAGELNDMWKYSAGKWTFMGGSTLTDQPGVHGARGVLAASNIPGGRNSAVSWTDAAGNFLLFGGRGNDVNGVKGDLSDVWAYSAGQWKWMGGSDLAAQPGVYGTQGTAAAANFPGARNSAVGISDAAGNFWLFGGLGLGSTTTPGQLSDLWKYGAAGQWTWMSGPSIPDQPGIYGTLGVSDPNNIPGARIGSSGWSDAAGNLWIFGGSTKYNDLWKYEQ
ncbi:MAG: hypothetical protein JWQ87_363 [Candidatus Sulfotelmatobacter sp.]|nr:hypothetical protein [Candidatus Sulfotelmatobacter sp.]